MNFSYKVKRFFRNFEIENLMTYIAASMAIVFVGDMLTNGLMSSYLSFSRSAILEGQVWRLLTFLFIPQTNSVVWIIFSVYFYYITGKETEMAWGAHNLTMYFLTGTLLLIGVGFIAGAASSSYLLFSLFLVYAYLYPEMEFLMFFVVPIKAKWLALIDIVFMLVSFGDAFKYYLYGMASVGLGIQLSVLAAFVTFAIFFGKNYIDRFKNRRAHKAFFNRNNINVTKGGRNGDDE